ncbi:hypothetical protein J5N97_023999 [Dioscorea zingiberensis]|uniref:E3 ubiquitin-protein ligase RMA n=1 Tax=Dioscorea zingiberensis TaxID=325984 RepID=A0A9D5H8I3_9LILI|nr:hypothetical protein J5N97_023999 [Dioscorea zingiberensis]
MYHRCRHWWSLNPDLGNMEVGGTGESCFREVLENEEEDPAIKCNMSQASAGGCFDCNICLDFAEDPVVTLCGHLYCWPCIYKWMQVQAQTQQQCPVCKAALSENTLVPLYGRGCTNSEKQPNSRVPRWRPAVQRDTGEIQTLVHRQQHQQQQYLESHIDPYDSNVHSASLETRVINSRAGEPLGGIASAVLPWAFRRQEAQRMHNLSMNHQMVNVGNWRMRMQEREVERSLHQIWIFLSCCALLCLILF